MLTSPVFRILKTQLDAEVHHLCKSQFAGVLKHNPYIDRQWILDDDLTKTMDLLKRENFDAIIDLQHNLRSIRISKGLGIATSRVDKRNLDKWLLVNLKWDRLPDVHIVDRYLDACAGQFTIENDGKGLDFHLPDDKEAIYQSIKTTHHLDSNYICMAIGAAHQTKQIPVNKMVAIADAYQHLQIILLGGPYDEERGNEIIKDTASANVINLAGKSTLMESCIVLDNATLLITPDTGLMHIAAALDVPTVSLWGNTVPKFGMYPYPKNHESTHEIVEVSGLSCRPCSKIGHQSCPKGHFKCMNDIKTEYIVEKISKFIE